MADEKVTVQITTRIDPEVAEVLQTIATAERRSMSAQLAIIVDAFIAEHLTKIGN
jgi:hypothetical protein